MSDKQIGLAKQEGSRVIALDAKGSRLFSKSGLLHGYTASTLTVRESSRLVTYDVKGNRISSTSV